MIFLTLVYTSLFGNAFAQNAGSDSESDKIRTIDFERVEVQGQLDGPDGAHVKENTRAVFHPLVQLRRSFSEEMQHSINNL